MKKHGVAILTALLVAVLLAACGNRNAASTPAAPAPIAATPVRADNEIIVDGVVVPVRSAALNLPTAGIVDEILVAEGAPVSAGEPILRLRSDRQQAAVAQAEATLGAAQARLAELSAGARTQEIEAAAAAVDAATAQIDRLQAGARTEDIAAAQAAVDGAQASLQQVQEGAPQGQIIAANTNVADAEAALRLAQAAYDQVAGQPDVGRRPESLQLEQATNAYNAAVAQLNDLTQGATAAEIAAAQAAVRQAQAQLDSVKAAARPADLASAQAELRRAQAQFDLLKAGTRPETVAAAEADVASARAAVQQAQAALDETVLTAPFAGTVAQLIPAVGETVSPGAPVVQLADLTAWQIETDDLTELDVVRISEGSQVLLNFDALPNVELTGHITQIKPIGVNKQGDITYTVVIIPDEFNDQLRWNMTAAVTIQTE
ncbi:MAG: HlyD family efflux transporter periplasmic adaptor subunit [Caldilineae bacterium]|nr:HlyD family efflux transporter periplasmic adaptor subunit [Anaerolineae bacterium]MCB0204178.1 HlyD family efflux transporter periplasmic adaptor subunit [Anaerolineae bacterium]MCB9152995.1 HlyD family efflux transporter periplasmic adaptor subunit [Caldilineae bacterium]